MGTLEQLRVLVVEDRFSIASWLCDVLAEHGAVVVGPAAHVPEAKQLVEQGGIDVALLNVNLGREYSHEVVRQLQARSVPVVLLTGFNAEDLPEDLAELPIVEKPVETDVMVCVIREQVGRRAGQR